MVSRVCIDARLDVLDRRILAQGATAEEWAIEVAQPVEGVWTTTFYVGAQSFRLADHTNSEQTTYAEEHCMFIGRMFVKALGALVSIEAAKLENHLERANEQVERLQGTIERANNHLFDSRVDDPQHQVDSHADTLPQVFLKQASGHEAALETLQEVIREWVEPTPTIEPSSVLGGDGITPPPDAACSFCGKRVGEPASDFRPEPVRYVIEGPKVTICDECVSLCEEILSENGITPARSPCTLDNCGHMRQLDAIVDLLGMPRGTRSVLDELRARAAGTWEDVEDEWTPAINAAHPSRSGSHDEYGTAMMMVGHRHSKGELVALVNWLLVLNKRGERVRP